MKHEIKVPSGGESVTEATVAELIAASGSFVEKEAELIELETDKVNQVLYAPAAGTVEWNVSVDDVVTVGQVLGTIDDAGQGEAAPKVEAPKTEQKEAKAPPPSKPAPAGKGARMSVDEYLEEKASPLPPAPKSERPPEKKLGGTRKRMSGLRRTIAKKLVEVKNETAMLTTFNEVDMSEVIAIRSREKENFEKKHGVRLGFMSFFIRASSQALKAFPDVGAILDGDELVYSDHHDIGMSVSTDRGLMVPVIRECEHKSFAELESELIAYAKKARDGKIAVADLQGGIYTITNGGVFGSMLSTPILNPPQSAILGLHNIVKRPVAIGDKVEIRPMMYLALSYDHRVIDGKEAVQFLVHIKQNLEDPARLLLDF